jgi:hypothetical protein
MRACLGAKLKSSPKESLEGQRKKLMTKQKRTRIQILGLVSLSLIIAAMSYGFAGVNASSAGLLGVGYGVLSEYQVSKISYTLDVNEPTSFTAVEFAADQVDGSILAGVSATKTGAIVWADDCQQDGAFWTCTFSETVDVLAADWLHVSGVK